MHDCPFCRTPLPKNSADVLAMIMTRVEKKDPSAIYSLGAKYGYGELGLEKDERRAMELWAEAAELGSISAHFNLGVSYWHGEGVEQDKAKGVHFFEKAAMQGHAESRHQIGLVEGHKGNHVRAVRHLLISAKMGHEDSVETIKKVFSKETQRKSSTQRH